MSSIYSPEFFSSYWRSFKCVTTSLRKKHKPLVCSRTGLLYLGYIRRLRFTSQAHTILCWKEYRRLGERAGRPPSLLQLSLLLLPLPWQQPRTFAIWLKRGYSYLPFWNLRLLVALHFGWLMSQLFLIFYCSAILEDWCHKCIGARQKLLQL